ncbi:MAG: NAD-dependent epimerase/dehydratase family protein [Candidatus Caenarcaniphilales bacterium]|nr:NAD-dependent epimerase/dehydratase family protein [Candidatus Caenarcaniphilales bacterium]
MSEKVLVVGGSGFIGGAVIKILKAKGYQVKILSRYKKGEAYISGDLLEPDSLVRAVEGNDYVIQAAQFPGHPVERPWLGEAYTYEGLDGQGTVNLVRAIQEVKPALQRLIYLSGAGAGLGDDYPWLRAKRLAEGAVKGSGVPYTILRPSWVYGKGDRSMSKFVLFAKYLPFFPVIGDGKAPVNPVWVEDLAHIIVASLKAAELQNQTVEIGSRELTMLEVARTVLRLTGQSKPIIPHPKPLMKLGGLFAQFIPGSPLSPGSVEFLTMDVHLGDLAESIAGVKIHSLEEGLLKSGLM